MGKTSQNRCYRIKADGKGRCRQPLTEGRCRFHGAATTPALAAVAAASSNTAAASPFTAAGPAAGPATQPDADPVAAWRSRPPSYWDQAARTWQAKATAHEHELAQAHGRTRAQRLTTQLRAELATSRAAICRDRGRAPFPGLYRGGKPVNARHTPGHDGQMGWLVYRDDDPHQRGTPQRIVDTTAALTEAGYDRRVDLVPAWSRLQTPSGHGEELATALASTKVTVVRLDGGRPLTDPQLAAA